MPRVPLCFKDICMELATCSAKAFEAITVMFKYGYDKKLMDYLSEDNNRARKAMSVFRDRYASMFEEVVESWRILSSYTSPSTPIESILLPLTCLLMLKDLPELWDERASETADFNIGTACLSYIHGNYEWRALTLLLGYSKYEIAVTEKAAGREYAKEDLVGDSQSDTLGTAEEIFWRFLTEHSAGKR